MLMPQTMLHEARSVHELQVRCRVSPQAAEIRFSQWQRKTSKRPELSFVREHIDYLKSLTPHRRDEAKATKERQVRAAWQALEQIEGEDPRVFRMCGQGIYRVAWSEFEKNSECGWFIRDKKVIAWIATAS